jgi:hypothetical protein
MKIESGLMNFNFRETLALVLFRYMDFDKDTIEGKPCLYNRIILFGMRCLLRTDPVKYVAKVVMTGAELGYPGVKELIEGHEDEIKSLEERA